MGVERIINLLALAANTRIPDKIRDLLTTDDTEKSAPANPPETEPQQVVKRQPEAPKNDPVKVLGDRVLVTGNAAVKYATDGTEGLYKSDKRAVLESDAIKDDQKAILTRADQVPPGVYFDTLKNRTSIEISRFAASFAQMFLKSHRFSDDDDRDDFIRAARVAPEIIPILREHGLA